MKELNITWQQVKPTPGRDAQVEANLEHHGGYFAAVAWLEGQHFGLHSPTFTRIRDGQVDTLKAHSPENLEWQGNPPPDAQEIEQEYGRIMRALTTRDSVLNLAAQLEELR